MPLAHNETCAETGWFDPCMTGPSDSVDGLTQLRPAFVGVSVVVGVGDKVCDEVAVGVASPVVVGVGVVPAA